MKFERINVLKLTYLFLILLSFNNSNQAQHSGNAVYGTNNNPHYNITRTNGGNIQSGKTFLISSDVLYHAVADRYVAVFGVVQEGKTIKDCSASIESRISNFKQAILALGVSKDAIFSDAISQNRVYEYKLDKDKNLAEEKLKGFEIKKNVIISYKDDKVLEKVMIAASEEGIYDLIKVDYIIDNPDAVYESLYEEALKIIDQKKDFYLKLSEKKYFGYPQIIKFQKDMIMPIQAYKSYTAHESNSITANNYYKNNSNFKKISARRTSTHYFEAAPKVNFDKIINEHQLEPCVQFIVRLQLRFEAL